MAHSVLTWTDGALLIVKSLESDVMKFFVLPHNRHVRHSTRTVTNKAQNGIAQCFRRRSRCRGRIQRVIALLLAATCPLYAAESNDSALPRVEALHMWQAQAEQEALNVIRTYIEEAGVLWKDTAVGGNMAGVDHAFNLSRSQGHPPSVVHWIVGDKIRRLINADVLVEIPDEDGFFKDHLIDEAYLAMRSRYGVYGVPLGIHIQNHMIYNATMLEENQLDVAQTWEQLVSYGPELASKDQYLISLSDQGWQLRKLFLSILSSVLTRTEFDAFVFGKRQISKLEAKLAVAIDILASLRQYSMPDYANKSWQTGTDDVRAGKALVQVLGDYIVSQLDAKDDVICTVTPDSNFIYWGMDSFVFVNTDDSQLLAGQKVFLDAVRSAQVMSQYTARKGGVPVYKGVQKSDLHPCMSAVLAQWEAQDEKLWLAGDAWIANFENLGETLARHWGEDEWQTEVIVNELIDVVFLRQD